MYYFHHIIIILSFIYIATEDGSITNMFTHPIQSVDYSTVHRSVGAQDPRTGDLVSPDWSVPEQASPEWSTVGHSSPSHGLDMRAQQSDAHSGNSPPEISSAAWIDPHRELSFSQISPTVDIPRFKHNAVTEQVDAVAVWDVNFEPLHDNFDHFARESRLEDPQSEDNEIQRIESTTKYPVRSLGVTTTDTVSESILDPVSDIVYVPEPLHSLTARKLDAATSQCIGGDTNTDPDLDFDRLRQPACTADHTECDTTYHADTLKDPPVNYRVRRPVEPFYVGPTCDPHQFEVNKTTNNIPKLGAIYSDGTRNPEIESSFIFSLDPLDDSRANSAPSNGIILSHRLQLSESRPKSFDTELHRESLLWTLNPSTPSQINSLPPPRNTFNADRRRSLGTAEYRGDSLRWKPRLPMLGGDERRRSIGSILRPVSGAPRYKPFVTHATVESVLGRSARYRSHKTPARPAAVKSVEGQDHIAAEDEETRL